EDVLAGWIVGEAGARKLDLIPVEEFQAHPGAGVSGFSAAGRVVVGTRRLLEEQGTAISPEADAVLERLDAAGQTALLVARDGAVIGAVGARDRVRPEAAQVLQELTGLGIRDVV